MHKELPHQYISIVEDRLEAYFVAHEVFHALGRAHEHSRPDRHMYIKVIYENIAMGWCAACY